MSFTLFRYKAAFTSLAALSVFLPVTACDLLNNHSKIDRTTNSEVQDYRDALAQREVSADAAKKAASAAAAVPDLESYVADQSSSLKSAPMVSISINQSIPLREALFELSKQANYDIELDPRINGSIIFTARNKPFDEVIDRICEISGLRYKFDDSTLRIEIDTPYSKNYKIDYLSFVRSSTSNVKTDVSVASSGQTSSGGGSSFSIDSKAESNFWSELDMNLKQILESNAAGSYLKTDADPQIKLTSSNPNLPPAPPIDAAALSEAAPQAGYEDYVSSPQMVTTTSGVSAPSADGTSTETTGTPVLATATPPSSNTLSSAPTSATIPAVMAPESTTMVASPVPTAYDSNAAPIPVTAQPAPAAQQPVLRVESLPTTVASGGSANASGANQVEFKPAYSINKQAGIVSIYANERLQRKIQDYLKDLRRATTSQVLIEAKVLEVGLTDEFSTGINWDLLDNVGAFDVAGTFTRPGLSPSEGGSNFRIGFAGQDISSFVSALSRFGSVHALASPRLTVLNNQAAVLNVAKNQVYFELKVSSDTTSDGVNSTKSVDVESTIKTVPEGVLINVMPSINLDSRMVSMQVRPTVTKIDSYVDDPAVAYIVATNNLTGVSSRIPVVNVQEVDSVVNMKDGQMMVMGGLLQDTTSSTQTGVPVASEVPMLGGLFRNQGDKVRKTELVVFIKATILDNPSNSIHQTDKDMYRLFGQDRRPEAM